MKSDRVITVVGCHAEGEVGRVITGGVLPPPGDTMFEKKTYLEQHNDGLRKFLIREPRGGAFVHVNLITPPVSDQGDAGLIIMEPTDYPPMSGSNSICAVTVLLETGMVAMTEPETIVHLDTPGGLVRAVAHCRDGCCERVTIENVPSFVAKLDATVDVPGIGPLSVDIAYGGAFFALVDATPLGFGLVPEEARALVEMGERIKQAVVEAHPVEHPENPAIRAVTFTQFTGAVSKNPDGIAEGRNAVVISPGKIDRSPCGTGTSARLAVLAARGLLGAGDEYVSRSLIDSRFDARILGMCTVGGQPAIRPSLSGRAWITGLHHYSLDPADPFPEGYALSDTWYRVV